MKSKRAKTTEQFIKEAKEKHGNDKYDYSLVNYVNNRTYVKIRCPRHNIVFSQLPYKHLQGNGCKLCGREESLRKQLNNPQKKHKRKLTLEDFLKRAIVVHGNNYDYSLVDYKTVDEPVIIICNECKNSFPQSPYKHINREQGCPFCANNIKLTKEQFIERSRQSHSGDKYDYSKSVYIRAGDPIEIFCKECKKYFWQSARYHMGGGTCPYCLESAGEERIRLFLEGKDFEDIKPQKKFSDLFDKDLLSYDFHLTNHRILIEYNGIQHYKKETFGKTYKEFLIQKHHDWLKRRYARKNDYKLIIIPYLDFDNIEKILIEELSLEN